MSDSKTVETKKGKGRGVKNPISPAVAKTLVAEYQAAKAVFPHILNQEVVIDMINAHTIGGASLRDLRGRFGVSHERISQLERRALQNLALWMLWSKGESPLDLTDYNPRTRAHMSEDRRLELLNKWQTSWKTSLPYLINSQDVAAIKAGMNGTPEQINRSEEAVGRLAVVAFWEDGGRPSDAISIPRPPARALTTAAV